MKNVIFYLVIISLLLSGCSFTLYKKADFVDHPEPDYDYPDVLISQTGCVSAGTENDWDCGPETQLAALGCERMSTDNLLGGFSPSYLVLGCHPLKPIKSNYFISRSSCLGDFVGDEGSSDGFILGDGKTYRLLDLTDLSDLKNTFAPIDTAEEALSYAILASEFYKPLADLWPQFKIDTSYGFTAYYSRTIEGTHVDPVQNGYEINLFSGFGCGCDYKSIYEVKTLVLKNGDIQVLDKALKYKTDMVCVD